MWRMDERVRNKDVVILRSWNCRNIAMVMYGLHRYRRGSSVLIAKFGYDNLELP